MKTCERRMVEAIRNKRSYTGDNTKVDKPTSDGRTDVRLFGNLIASVYPDRIEVSDCGWRTKTTKSRINEILRAFADEAVFIAQKDYRWSVIHFDGDKTRESEWEATSIGWGFSARWNTFGRKKEEETK